MAELRKRLCGSRKGGLYSKEKPMAYLVMAYTIIILILVYLIARRKRG